jgi:DUF3025 family protein
MDWIGARERLRSPIHAPLRAALARLAPERWPTLEDLGALASGVTTAQGRALRFVPPRDPAGEERRHYEARIAATGEVETRPECWHDLFNALAWIRYPRAKARINAQHAAILAERGAAELRKRSPERDALTLFDEGGLIVASSAPHLLRLVADFEWKELFWARRSELAASMDFFAFGHACFEQALAPYLGMVAKTVFIEVEPGYFGRPYEERLAEADARVAAHFADRARFASPKAMAPLPLLGIPGWHPGTERESFYDDARHFRSRPRPQRKMPA